MFIARDFVPEPCTKRMYQGVPLYQAGTPCFQLRGKDLNLRPSGYEEAGSSLCGLVSLGSATLARGGTRSTLGFLAVWWLPVAPKMAPTQRRAQEPDEAEGGTWGRRYPAFACAVGRVGFTRRPQRCDRSHPQDAAPTRQSSPPRRRPALACEPPFALWKPRQLADVRNPEPSADEPGASRHMSAGALRLTPGQSPPRAVRHPQLRCLDPGGSPGEQCRGSAGEGRARTFDSRRRSPACGSIEPDSATERHTVVADGSLREAPWIRSFDFPGRAPRRDEETRPPIPTQTVFQNSDKTPTRIQGHRGTATVFAQGARCGPPRRSGDSRECAKTRASVMQNQIASHEGLNLLDASKP